MANGENTLFDKESIRTENGKKNTVWPKQSKHFNMNQP